LFELVQLLYERRASVGKLHHEPHVRRDAAIPAVLLDRGDVLADKPEI
jgi:hypothetical protein